MSQLLAVSGFAEGVVYEITEAFVAAEGVGVAELGLVRMGRFRCFDEYRSHRTIDN